MRFESERSAGLTLIEILVVVAILGILLGIALPMLASARASAHRAVCANHQRQIAMAGRAYAADYRDYLGQAGVLDYRDGTHVNNGRNLPQMFIQAGMNNPYTRHPDHYTVLGYLPGDASSNDGPEVFRCPAARRYFGEIGSTYWENKGNVTSHYFFSTLINPPTKKTSSRQPKNNVWGPYKGSQIQRPNDIFLLGDGLGYQASAGAAGPASIHDTFTWEQLGEVSTVFGVATSSTGTWLDNPPPYHRGGPNGTFYDGHVETIVPPDVSSRYELRPRITADFSGRLIQ